MLSDLLQPLSFDEFRASIWGQRPLVVPGAGDKFSSLFSFDSLNRLLNEAPSPHPTIKLNKGGQSLQPTDAAGLIRHVRDGATLVLENAERYDGIVAQFVDALSSELCFPTRANVYYSQPRQQGYHNHYDTHDFFILQAEGEKEWFIYPPTVDEPLFVQKQHGLAPPPASSLVMQRTLKKGDLLYVPKGWWHYACATDEPSVHLTIALFQRTGIDFLTWIVNELRDDLTFRRTFPLLTRHELPMDIAAEHPYQSTVDSLATQIHLRLHDRTLGARYSQFVFAGLPNPVPFSFPRQIDEIRITGSTQVSVTHRAFLKQYEQGLIVYTGYGKILRFDPALETSVDRLLSRSDISASELCDADPNISEETALAIIRLFLTDGFVKPQTSGA